MTIVPAYSLAAPHHPGLDISENPNGWGGQSTHQIVDLPDLGSVVIVQHSSIVARIGVSVVNLTRATTRTAMLAIPEGAANMGLRVISGGRVLIAYTGNRVGWDNHLAMNNGQYLVVFDANTMQFGAPVEVIRPGGGDSLGYGVYDLFGLHRASETEWTAVAVGLLNPPTEDLPFMAWSPLVKFSYWGTPTPGYTPHPDGDGYTLEYNLHWYDGYLMDFLSRRLSIHGTRITVSYSWALTRGVRADNVLSYTGPQGFILPMLQAPWTDEVGTLSLALPATSDWATARRSSSSANVTPFNGMDDAQVVQLSFSGPTLTGVHAAKLAGPFMSTESTNSYAVSFERGMVSAWLYRNDGDAATNLNEGYHFGRGYLGSPLGLAAGNLSGNRLDSYGLRSVWADTRKYVEPTSRPPGLFTYMEDPSADPWGYTGRAWQFRLGEVELGTLGSGQMSLRSINGAPSFSSSQFYFATALHSARTGVFVVLWANERDVPGRSVITVFQVGADINSLESGRHRAKGHFS